MPKHLEVNNTGVKSNPTFTFSARLIYKDSFPWQTMTAACIAFSLFFLTTIDSAEFVPCSKYLYRYQIWLKSHHSKWLCGLRKWFYLSSVNFLELKSLPFSSFIYTCCKPCHLQDLPYQAVFNITLSDLSFLKFLFSNISLPYTHMFFSFSWSTLWHLWPAIFPEYYHLLMRGLIFCLIRPPTCQYSPWQSETVKWPRYSVHILFRLTYLSRIMQSSSV